MKTLFKNLVNYYWGEIQVWPDIRQLENWINGLVHFCGYAFERAGSPPVYSEAATRLIKEHRNQFSQWKRLTKKREEQLTAAYEGNCKAIKPKLKGFNKDRNPMYFTEGDKQITLIRFTWTEIKRKSIFLWAKSLVEANRLEDAYNSLVKIKGVSEKIAPFYLRDIYLKSNRSGSQLEKLNLIQPIDIWTERAAQELLNNRKANRSQCANALLNFEKKIGIKPGESNIAFWVLGAEIFEDEERFREAVRCISNMDKTAFNRTLQKEIKEQLEWIEFLAELNKA